MSQRTDGFKGGIQANTTASSLKSKRTESTLRLANRTLTTRAENSDLLWVPGLSSKKVAKGLSVPLDTPLVGVYPDGGLWSSRGESGQLLVASEAKKQGKNGNAIERWFKNWEMLDRLGVKTYITICSGEGFFNNNSAEKILTGAVANSKAESHRIAEGTLWNTPTGRLWFYRYMDEVDLEEVTSLITLALEGARSNE